MSLYIYLKKDNSVKRKMVNYFSYVTLVLGAFLLFWSFYPILSFELYSRLFIQNNIQSPLPKSMMASSLEQANSVLSNTHSVFSNNLRDFTDVKLWFPNRVKNYHLPKLALKEYQLSIPKINIKNVRVVVNGEDLSKYLVHFMAQSAPGEYGNIVIFGHSTLPQLYNPKDYKTIFTYLPSLEKKDHIYLKVNDISYEYEIFDMFVIDPDQVSVLEQHNDASYLTLITCVPPGTFWKRLVIRAKMTKLPNTF
jgi:sortase A